MSSRCDRLPLQRFESLEQFVLLFSRLVSPSLSPLHHHQQEKHHHHRHHHNQLLFSLISCFFNSSFLISFTSFELLLYYLFYYYTDSRSNRIQSAPVRFGDRLAISFFPSCNIPLHPQIISSRVLQIPQNPHTKTFQNTPYPSRNALFTFISEIV